VRYGTEHGDPFLGRSMGTQPDYSHEVAQIIDDEVRKLIEAAHTEAWEVLTEYRDVLDTLAGELLEKETLHRVELEAIFGDVKKRPRLTIFDDFGGRVPSDKPPIKTPGELAIERGEPWPPPVPEPAFKLAIAEASTAHPSTGLRTCPATGQPPTAPRNRTTAPRPVGTLRVGHPRSPASTRPRRSSRVTTASTRRPDPATLRRTDGRRRRHHRHNPATTRRTSSIRSPARPSLRAVHPHRPRTTTNRAATTGPTRHLPADENGVPDR
jgi:hypothetical protein